MRLRIKFKLFAKTPDSNYLIPLFIVGIGGKFDVFLVTVFGIECYFKINSMTPAQNRIWYAVGE